MQIEINGKRNITLDFNAPKKFRLVKDGAEIPYIRTGKNSFRLSKPVDGFVELEEIVEQPRYMQPVQLKPQQMTVINPQDVDRLNEAVRQMALVNPQDVMIINQTAEQLEKNQNFIAQTQKEITDNQVYIDQQQQRLNETALGIQALETDNSQRLDGAENAILNLAGEISNAQTMIVDGINTVSNKIDEQGISLQAEIDTKADKDELESLKKDFEEKSDRISSAMANYSGGTAYDTLPQGGEAGQILAKRTDRQGDYVWIDQTPVIVKSETIPTASEKYKGEVYQYVGETGDYTHGYIYECQQNGNSYEWVRIDVQPNTAVWGQITGTLSDQTDLQDALDNKQDKLSQTQMDAVNSGANQSNIAQITTNQGNITTIQTTIAGKQDTLVSGTNIKTINNNSILGSGNLNIDGLPSQTGQNGKFLSTDGTNPSWANVDALPSQTGQSGKYLTTDGSSASWATLSVNPDNKSITTNSSDELQTVGVISARDNTTAIKIYPCTKAQYDAIATKDPNTLYNITDDTDVSLTILEALYPVGSVYITTANTCPLSALISGSTWTLRSSGVVTSVDTNVPVKGNNKALGLTDTLTNFGIAPTNAATTNGYVTASADLYNTQTGTGGTPMGVGTSYRSIGVTTDASKSGIVGTVTRSILSVNIFERTA